MKITRQILIRFGACEESIEWYSEQNTTDSEVLIKKLREEEKYEWVRWAEERLKILQFLFFLKTKTN